MGGHVAQGARQVHDEGRPGRNATLPEVENCNFDQHQEEKRCPLLGQVKAPGNAEAGGEAEIPVTEDGKTRGAAESTLRHTLPDITMTTITTITPCHPKELQIQPDPSADDQRTVSSDANHLKKI